MRLVRANFELVRRRADHTVKFFYATLFRDNPGVRTMFPADLEEQRDRLFAALGYVVTHLDDPALPAVLTQLGRDHRKFEVSRGQYDAVGASLIAALKFASGHSWDERTEAAWAAAYAVVAEAMQQGGAQSETAGEPAYWDALVLDRRLHEGHTAVLTVRPDRPYPYAAGQYATLSTLRRPRVWRPYSLGCAPRRDGIVEFHVARAPGGLLSPVLCDEIRPGDRLRLGAASGTTTLAGPAAPAVTLVAAGTGWSSVKALLGDLVRAQPRPRVRLELLARARNQYYDLAWITALSNRHPWIEVGWWYPQPYESQTQALWRFRTAMAARGDWGDQQAYLSGPPAFIAELADLLPRCGLHPDRLRYDPVPPPVAAERTPVTHAERLLAPRPVAWIDPAARTGRSLPGPEPARQDAAPAGRPTRPAGRHRFFGR